MFNRTARSPRRDERKRRPTPSIIIAGIALFIALGGSAIAAKGLVQSKDIATGAITSPKIKDGAVELRDLSASTQQSLQGGGGATGATGEPGPSGASGSNGANGANGANGPNGANGVNGVDGTDGIDGVDGTDGIDGTIQPLSATQGTTALPTGTPPTTVVSLAVPAGNYVVLAKSQLTHSGAGDTVDCLLKSGSTTLDQVAMSTLPALAAIPMSLQAVTTAASPTQLSVTCDVLTANGTASSSSLIAIPTG